MRVLSGRAKCPGTCGEWVQGAKDGIPFLIGCPINHYVEAKVEIQPLERGLYQWILPEQKEKTRRALYQLAEHLCLPVVKGLFQMDSQLLTGKGMASSTADMIAAMSAVARAFQLPIEAEVLVRIALSVEPTDPVMFEGITEFAHRDGSYIRPLGPVVPAQLLMLDWGGVLDTQQFNARRDLGAHYRKHERLIRKAAASYYEGIADRDLEKIAYASTLSARCNQEINPKSQFEGLLTWVRENGGLGLVAAHSGTLLAGVFPVSGGFGEEHIKDLQQEAQARFKPEYSAWASACGGGVL